MPKVDFHILEQATGLKSLHYACQLIEKAHAENKRVYVHTSSREEAERMDMLLWTYRDDSFLPHQIYYAANEFPAPIQIGYSSFCHASERWHPETDKILLNLNNEFPSFFQSFNHIIEIVFPDSIVQQLARERFKQYRDQSCELNTYKIKAQDL